MEVENTAFHLCWYVKHSLASVDPRRKMHVIWTSRRNLAVEMNSLGSTKGPDFINSKSSSHLLTEVSLILCTRKNLRLNSWLPILCLALFMLCQPPQGNLVSSFSSQNCSIWKLHLHKTGDGNFIKDGLSFPLVVHNLDCYLNLCLWTTVPFTQKFKIIYYKSKINWFTLANKRQNSPSKLWSSS